MLGATLRFELSRAPNLDVWGTVRDKSRSTKMASVTCGQHLITGWMLTILTVWLGP